MLPVPRRKRIVPIAVTVLDRSIFPMRYDLDLLALRLLPGTLKGFGLRWAH